MKAKLHTFLIYDTARQRVIMVTSSARFAKEQLTKGTRVDVWSGYNKIETVYSRNAGKMNPYVRLEKEHHREKQEAAERRNARRRAS